MAIQSRKQSRIHSRKQSTKKATTINKCYLVPLNKITTKQIEELSVITRDIEVMKYIGKGNIWTVNDIKQFVKDENIEAKKNNKNRMYYSYIMVCNNKVIGFIAGRKKKNLLPSNTTPYDLLMRMFISRKQFGKGFGKLIIKLFIEMYCRMISKVISDIKKNKKNNGKENGIPRIKLVSDIDKDNISSIKIHLANGFQFIDTVKYPNKHFYERYILEL